MKFRLANLIYEVNRHCNYNCKYCYNHWKSDGDESPPDSGYKIAIKTLKRIYKFADVKQITFTGGEPTLIDRLAELILFSKLHRSAVNLITNGSLLTDDFLNTLIDLKVDNIQIPFLSSNPHIHDFLTSTPGSWEKSVNAIRTIKAFNGRAIPVIVLTKQNCAGIGDTLEFLIGLKCNYIMANRFNIGGAGIANKDLLDLTKNELNESFSIVNSYSKRYNLFIHSGVCTPVCVINPKSYPHIHFSFCEPDLHSRPLTLDFTGNIRFCNHSPNIMGNIFSQSLLEIIELNKNKIYYNETPDYCKSCNEYHYCKAGCRAASEQLGYDFRIVDPVVHL